MSFSRIGDNSGKSGVASEYKEQNEKHWKSADNDNQWIYFTIKPIRITENGCGYSIMKIFCSDRMGKFNKFSGGGKGYERKYCRDSRDGLALTQVDQDLIYTADADEFFNLQTTAEGLDMSYPDH